MDGAPGAASAPAQASPTSPPPAPRHGQRLESGPADQSAVPNFEKSTPPVTKQGCEFWSIPVGNLRSLIRDLEKDIQVWISQKAPKYNDDTGRSVELNGKSYPFAEYFRQMKIDPKRHVRYSKYYSNQRHTIAGSYVWADSNLTEFADELEKPVHSEKLCWIDVLINCQYEIENSGQVVGLTGEVYSNCDVLILLSASIFTRAWCLLEAANYTRNGCKLHVVGRCSFLQGEDYFSAMKAGVESDVGLIKDEIARKFGSGFHAKFNSAIDDAVVQVYGESLLYNGCYQQAVPVFEKELELKTRRGDDEESIASTYVQLGRVFRALGDYPKALHYYDEALKSQVRRFGTGHEIVAITQNNMAVVLEAQGKLEEALELYQKSLDTKIQAVGPDHVSVAETQNNVAMVLEQQGKYQEALELYQKSLETKIRAVGPAHVSVASTQNNMAVVLEAQGKLEEALELYQKCLDTKIRAVGPDHVSVARTHENIGYVHKALDNFEKALEFTDKASKIYSLCLGPNHVDSTRTKKSARHLKEMTVFPRSPSDSDEFNFLRRHRGRVGDVHIQSSVLFFKNFCTVQVDCFCPLGSCGYYEIEIITEGDYTQWGFCTEKFLPMDGYTGEGVGDDFNSWGFDGYRGMLWHSGEAGKFECTWNDGDIIGLACNLTGAGSDGCEEAFACIQVSVNGRFQDNSYAFKLPPNLRGLYPAVSSMAGSARIRLGGSHQPLLHAPPSDSYRPMADFGIRGT